MQPRSILLVNNFLSSGASYSTGAELAVHLRKKGWRVVCTSHHRNKILRLADMLFTCIRAKDHYSVANVAVFSGAAFLWAEMTTDALKLLRRPVVLTLHGGNLPGFASRHPLRVRRLLEKASAVTAPSAYLAQQMATYRGDIQVIPNALDLDRYPFRLREKALPRLVWLRAFHEIYNPALAVPILAQLQDEFPDICLRMIGPVKDNSLEKTLAAAEHLGVKERIEIIPGVPKEAVPDELSRGDIFLNTTNIDNQPVSVLEAMACGLCVVSTNVGGLPYLINSGIDGILCPPNDIVLFVNAIHQILSQSNLSQKLSFNARNKAEKLDWNNIIPQWEDIFRIRI